MLFVNCSGPDRRVNLVNGQRQAYVNYLAESIGRSSGTFRRDGVPGTGVGGDGHGYAVSYTHGYPGNYGGPYAENYRAYPNAYPSQYGYHY